jgi:hypothetical protein
MSLTRKHISHRHSYGKILYRSSAIFLALFVTLQFSGKICTEINSNLYAKRLEVGLQTETQQLKDAGDAITKDPIFVDALARQDRQALLTYTKQAIHDLDIGLMGIANADGVILSRTLSPGVIGDNVFLTAPAGRVVATGRSVESIERTGFGDQIFLTTARSVYNQDQFLGAVFANRLLDEVFAVKLQEKYLKGRAELAFYTYTDGIYSSSFDEPTQRTLINEYFQPGSTWIADGETDKTVYIPGGEYYAIRNITFPGLNQSPGGVLIFIPRHDLALPTSLIIATLTTLGFGLMIYRQRLQLRLKNNAHSNWMAITFLACTIFCLSALAVWLQNGDYLTLTPARYPLYNSTLQLEPATGFYNLGYDQRVSIVVQSGDELVNSAAAVLTYDINATDVIALDTTNSDCKYVVENSIDTKNGVLNLSCVFQTIPDGQRDLYLGDIVFKPLRPGSVDLTFDRMQTQVLAHDGLGTNVLRTVLDGSYRVDNFNLTGNLTNLDSDFPERNFMLYSSSHPNSNHWYNLPQVDFVWIGPTDGVYRYVFDTQPNTLPSNRAPTVQGSQLSLPVPGDGIYYLHLQSVRANAVTHYRIQSDFTGPTITAFNASETTITEGDVVRFDFAARDAGSGVEKNYYIDIGNKLFLPANEQIYVPFLEAGKQNLTLRIYDEAGNYSEKQLSVTVINK